MGEELENHLTNTILKLEEIDVNLYRGSNLWKPVRSRAVFGGQVVGQALVAASKTVADHLHVHSLHTYFIRPGDNTLPILYHVDCLRDGNSFSTRSVKATQNGNTIITMQVSYHKEEEGVLSHQYTMPHAPPPDKLRTTEECLRTFLQDTRTSKQSKATIQKVLADEIPIEVKPVDPLLFFSRKRHSDVHSKSLVWIKASGHLGPICSERDMNLHRCVAAYISDHVLLQAAFYPSERTNLKFGIVTSLDHAMWFHAPFRADEWMLFETESPQSGHARAMTLGRMWRQDGTLAISLAQEGLIRGQLSKL